MSAPSSAEHGAGDSTRIAAARPRGEDIHVLARRERFAGALWPVPTLFGAGALVAATIMVALDKHFEFQVHGQRLLVADTDTALTLTSVVATGMLAFLGIVFATTLVAIQLAASQYSPRAVRVFVRSRLTKVCLGIFVATFAFSIVTLIAIRSAGGGGNAAFTPVLSMSGVELLVIATLVAFLVFANGTSRLLRVQYLIERIEQDTRPALDLAFGDDDVVDCARPDPALPAVEVVSASHGVLDLVDVGALLSVAERLDGWLEITAPVGTFIGRRTAIGIARLGPAACSADPDEIARLVDECLLFSNERTLLQDPGFGFRQLVDIAIRALSPAVNDPTTAVQVVDRLTDLLGQIPDRPDPSGWFAGQSGVARVLVPPGGFDELITLAFTEIIRYGADSPQVARRVSASLDSLEARARRVPRSGIGEMRHLLAAATQESSSRAFLALAEVPDPRGLG